MLIFKCSTLNCTEIHQVGKNSSKYSNNTIQIFVNCIFMAAGGLRRINPKYLDFLNHYPLQPPPMFPYYARHLPHNIFSIPPARGYPARDIVPLPLAGNHFPLTGEMLPLCRSSNFAGDMVPLCRSSNLGLHDIIPVSMQYEKDGLWLRFQMIGYSPSELRVVAHYDHIEVVASKRTNGNDVKETRQMIRTPYPVAEYGLQTGVEVDDGTVVVYVPWGY
uniref:Uncharacterized protein n=1 Tax=Cacopsylla melanoneura TaxID=428564 RepID=A0A8D8R1Z0_9HEMI